MVGAGRTPAEDLVAAWIGLFCRARQPPAASHDASVNAMHFFSGTIAQYSLDVLSAINAAAKVLAESKEPLTAKQLIEHMAAN